MRILFVSNKTSFFNDRFGGAQSSMRLLAECLAERGHDVYYFTKKRKGSFLPGTRKTTINNVNIMTFKYVKGWKRVSLIRYFNELLLEIHFRAIINKNKIQMIYLFYELDNMELVNRIKKYNPKIVSILRMAGLHWYEQCKKNRLLMRRYEVAFNSFDAINYIHEDLIEMVHEKINEIGLNIIFNKEFVADIGSSAYPEINNYKSKTGDDCFRMLMVSRFSTYQKRQDILVRAFAKIDPEYRLKLTFVGDGGGRERIEQLIRELSLTDRVKIVSFMKQKELWELMKETDLMCHATDYEGLGKIVVESMALGLPVLASDVPPLNGYIVDGRNGFLVKNDPEMWARKVVEVAFAPELRQRVSLNGIEYVRNKFLPSRNIIEIERIMEELVS